MPKRNVYLKLVSLDQAVSTLADALAEKHAAPCVENVPVQEAVGRTTAGPIFAALSSPAFHGAAMDGIAVKASETFAAREGRPVELAQGRGFAWVNTGNPLPEGFDAVVMVEQVETVDETTVRIEVPAFPWQHVRRLGEDIVAGELVFPRNHRLRPYDLGALLAAGVWELDVLAPPRVVVIPTGDEVLDVTTRPTPKPGQVVESNSLVLCALARESGMQASRVPPAPDDEEALSRVVAKALAEGADAVILCAGSSAGTKDFSRAVLERHGRVLVHGVAAMPGKPSILGVTDDGRLLAGAPGYPVSSVVFFEQLVRPIMAAAFRAAPPEKPRVQAVLARSVTSRAGMEEFLRLAVGRVPRDGGEAYVAAPLAKGAGLITSLSRAQGVARIPAPAEGLEAGARLDVELTVSRHELDRTLVAVGSHDNTLQLLADALMGLADPVRLASSHVGSMGGLAALKDGACLMAGMHLFDPATGDFNWPFIHKHLAGMELRLVNLAVRHQGLMAAPGNPLDIKGVADLARLRFVNRQRGSGTRILLDHHLAQAGLDPATVEGYGKEEFTHMAVAVNVATGAADCGLGIKAAAQALGLDFVPLARERYDLAVPAALWDDPRIKAVRELLTGPELAARIEALGGYEARLTGQEMAPGQGLGA